MHQINGMLLVLGVVVISALICLVMWFAYFRKYFKSSNQDKCYNSIMVRSVLPSNQGTPIDVVMANLKDEDKGRDI